MMNKKLTIGIIAAVAVGICATLYFVLGHNKMIPDEKKMAQILADIYMTDAILQNEGNLYSSSHRNDKTTENTYHTILRHYGLDKQTFDSIITWYSFHPEEYSTVYERLVNILTQREMKYEEILNRRDSVNKSIEHKSDSIRITYLSKNTVNLPGEPADSIKKDMRYEFEIDSTSKGTISARMTYVFPRKNEAKNINMEMIVVYNDTLSDTTSVVLNPVHVQRKAELEYTIRDTIAAHKLIVSLTKSKEFKKIYSTLSDISITQMPYDIRDSIQFDEILLPPLFAY